MAKQTAKPETETPAAAAATAAPAGDQKDGTAAPAAPAATDPTPPETGNEGMATAGAEEPVPASAATSAVKPPEADEARCIVASPVEKDGVAYAIGQDILLSEDEAKLLIAGGSVTPVVIEGADAP